MNYSKRSINPEMTKQMDQIWRSHHDPEEKSKRLAKIKKQEKLKDLAEDLGIDPHQIKNYDGGQF